MTSSSLVNPGIDASRPGRERPSTGGPQPRTSADDRGCPKALMLLVDDTGQAETMRNRRQWPCTKRARRGRCPSSSPRAESGGLQWQRGFPPQFSEQRLRPGHLLPVDRRLSQTAMNQYLTIGLGSTVTLRKLASADGLNRVVDRFVDRIIAESVCNQCHGGKILWQPCGWSARSLRGVDIHDDDPTGFGWPPDEAFPSLRPQRSRAFAFRAMRSPWLAAKRLDLAAEPQWANLTYVSRRVELTLS